MRKRTKILQTMALSFNVESPSSQIGKIIPLKNAYIVITKNININTHRERQREREREKLLQNIFLDRLKTTFHIFLHHDSLTNEITHHMQDDNIYIYIQHTYRWFEDCLL